MGSKTLASSLGEFSVHRRWTAFFLERNSGLAQSSVSYPGSLISSASSSLSTSSFPAYLFFFSGVNVSRRTQVSRHCHVAPVKRFTT